VARGKVSDARLLVMSGLERDVSNEFRYKVISAVNEAFIMKSFTGVSCRAGRPNVLVLSRTFADSEGVP
jgi:hypothetical protein